MRIVILVVDLCDDPMEDEVYPMTVSANKRKIEGLKNEEAPNWSAKEETSTIVITINPTEDVGVKRVTIQNTNNVKKIRATLIGTDGEDVSNY